MMFSHEVQETFSFTRTVEPAASAVKLTAFD